MEALRGGCARRGGATGGGHSRRGGAGSSRSAGGSATCRRRTGRAGRRSRGACAPPQVLPAHATAAGGTTLGPFRARSTARPAGPRSSGSAAARRSGARGCGRGRARRRRPGAPIRSRGTEAGMSRAGAAGVRSAPRPTATATAPTAAPSGRGSTGATGSGRGADRRPSGVSAARGRARIPASAELGVGARSLRCDFVRMRARANECHIASKVTTRGNNSCARSLQRGNPRNAPSRSWTTAGDRTRVMCSVRCCTPQGRR